MISEKLEIARRNRARGETDSGTASSSMNSSSSSSSASFSSGITLPSSAAAGLNLGSAPKILLAKPPGVGTAASKFAREDDSSAAAALRARVPPIGSLNLVISDSWDLHADRALPFLTENTDFTVIGIIGPPGVGKSTIMNELYGYDGSSGMLPHFPIQSDDTRLLARHCTIGIELRVSSERLILLDAQPVFSPSLMSEMTRPDGSSSKSVQNGEALSVDLLHELMCLQLATFLSSVCHVLLVVTEGIHDASMWQLMLTVDMLKHNIPDPSLITSGHVQAMKASSGKEWRDCIPGPGKEFLAIPIFVHTKLRQQDFSPRNEMLLKKMHRKFFQSSSFCQTSDSAADFEQQLTERRKNLIRNDLVFLPSKAQPDGRPQRESFISALGKLRDQVLSFNPPPFSKPISEREWLRNSAKVWEMVKGSPVIADYCRILQESGQLKM
ncbi:uncharacterized protein LOC144700300 [Wolffia australiana]